MQRNNIPATIQNTGHLFFIPVDKRKKIKRIEITGLKAFFKIDYKFRRSITVF